MYEANTQAIKQGWTVELSTPVTPGAAQAPGRITLCNVNSEAHPYAVHFFNEQDGGFHSGSYHKDFDEAKVAFEARVTRWNKKPD